MGDQISSEVSWPIVLKLFSIDTICPGLQTGWLEFWFIFTENEIIIMVVVWKTDINMGPYGDFGIRVRWPKTWFGDSLAYI